jgi:hypothetical protein
MYHFSDMGAWHAASGIAVVRAILVIARNAINALHRGRHKGRLLGCECHNIAPIADVVVLVAVGKEITYRKVTKPSSLY